MKTADNQIQCALHVVDVGQGDTSIFQADTGEIIIIDCHVRGQFGKSKIKRLLEDLFLQRGTGYDIELLCLTHRDIDHYRGMDALIDWIKENGGRIKNLILSAPPLAGLRDAVQREYDVVKHEKPPKGALLPPALARLLYCNQTFNEVHYRLSEVIVEIREANEGLYHRASDFTPVLSFGCTKVFILGPSSHTISEYSDKVWEGMVKAWIGDTFIENIPANELSCILWIHSGKVRMLLPGDSTREAMSRAFEDYENTPSSHALGNLQSDIVKASHHGAESSSSPELWRRMLKEDGCVAISAGAHNQYWHPHVKTVEDIKESVPGSRLFCTNHCRRRLDVILERTEKEVNLVRFEEEIGKEDFAQEDDARAPWRMGTTHESSTYEGSIEFKIHNDGAVVPVPEIENPFPSCPFHAHEPERKTKDGVIGFEPEHDSARRI